MAATKKAQAQAAEKIVESKLKASGKAMAQGIGASRLHGGHGPASPPKSEGCTVNGEPLPEEFWETFPYSLTDQGKAEAEALRKTLPAGYAGIDRTDYSEIFDDSKKAAKFRGDLAADTEGLIIIKDPMAPLIEKHTPRGHHGMFMSKTVMSRQGLVRGVLEYQIVYADDGQGGKKEVTCGGMILASVPQELYERAQRHYSGINREQQIAAVEQVQEQAQEIMDSGRDRGRRKRFAQDIGDIMKEDDGAADAELMSDRIDRREDREAGAFHE